MVDEVEIKVQRLRDDIALPVYAHGPNEDAGLDLRAAEDVELHPGEPRAVATGLRIELPPGYEGQIRPRSGLALRNAITVANSPGTIDPGYRGELKVILVNLGRESFTVLGGDRIAQLIVARYASVRWSEADLDTSERGASGFGSTGR